MKKITVIILFFIKGASCLFAQDQWELVHKELVGSNPSFKECHASSIGELSKVNMMAACFGGTGEGAKDVCIWSAVNKNRAWSKPVVIATGIVNDTLRYS